MKLLFFLLSLSIGTHATCPTPCKNEAACLSQYFIGTRKVDFYSNYPLDQSNNCIEHVIVAIHGTTRDAYSRFSDVRDAVKAHNLESKTLIIAPYFKTDEDNPDWNDYYWSSDGWKKGNTSNTGWRDVSSFSVTDLMLESVLSSNDFVSVNHVSITGHSAGGQYTQLYALTSPSPDNFSYLDFSFLVLNPSNYSYLNEYRPHPTTAGLFEIPVYLSGSRLKMKSPYNKTAGDCPNSYNDYKYGLNERNLYSEDISNNDLIYQYLNRHVFYFLGSLDTLQDSYLDTSCSAKIQGRYRLERGNNFFNFLNTFYYHNHELFIVDGVGHDAGKMYASSIVQNVLLEPIK